MTRVFIPDPRPVLEGIYFGIFYAIIALIVVPVFALAIVLDVISAPIWRRSR